MFKKLKNNPILLQQMRQARWPSLRTAVWIAVGLAVIGLALTIRDFLTFPHRYLYPYSGNPVLKIGGLLPMVYSLINAVVAVAAAVRTINDSDFPLDQISDCEYVRGTMASVFFRLRIMWVLVASLVLPTLVIILHIFDTYNLLWGHIYALQNYPSFNIAFDIGTVILSTVFYYFLFVTLNWSAVALGVCMGFRYRRTGKALIVTMFTLIPLIVIQSGWRIQAAFEGNLVISVLVFIGINSLLGWLSSNIAAQYVKKAYGQLLNRCFSWPMTMVKHLKNNPILAHQMRYVRWPSLRSTMWISAGLTVVGLAVTLAGLVVSPDGSNNLALVGANIISYIDWLLGFLGPILTAVVAVVATAQAVDTRTYQVIRLSQLSERDIVIGYIASAVYRLRGVWMIVGGLILPKLMAITHYGIKLTIATACMMQTKSHCMPPTPSEILMQQVGYALISSISNLALLIAWLWFAVTLGIWMSFHHHQAGKALVMSLLWMAVTLMIQILISGLFYTTVFHFTFTTVHDYYCMRQLYVVSNFVFTIGFMALGMVNFNRTMDAPK